MAKRGFDMFFSLLVLIIASPLLLIAVLGVGLSAGTPVLFRAQRIGRDGRPFSMLKLRTMRLGADRHGAITAPSDQRVFAFGVLLRRLKIDELPQFWNILKGDMSVVGPRPEDPSIVADAYTEWMQETLRVRPGVTSPGAVYGYLYGDELLDANDPEGSYKRLLLPPKLALERAYLDRAGFFSDIRYIFLTLAAVAAHFVGQRIALPARDIEAAQRWAPLGPYGVLRSRPSKG